ncbi:tyrosine-type recombinase/integrase [Acidobacteria bacterium AH-259-O06]|nr:tyrosine-type recombinase/integrase [Acidobacteria bacterium AH-259-O06]
MAINEWCDRNRKKKICVSRRWPDGSRFRRVMPNKTIAKKTLSRIEESIAMGTWRKLKEEFSQQDNRHNPTIEEFSDIYLEQYCLVQNRRPDFKEQALHSITEILGSLRLKQFTRKDARRFIVERSSEVAPATINRNLSVLKNMFSFAVEMDLIQSNPLQGFKMLPETERALRIMTYAEYRKLVTCVTDFDPSIGAFVAILGESAIRKSEGLRLTWDDIDFSRRQLIIQGETKGRKARYIPLSDFAIETLRTLVRVIDQKALFVRDNHKPWKDPRGPFFEGRKVAGLGWVRGFHDLRHFRATQWLLNGMDVNTVRELLGHSDINTTMRYVHYIQEHAAALVRKVSEKEVKEWS